MNEIKLYDGFGSPNCSIHSVQFSPDSKYLAACTEKGEILIQSVKSRDTVTTLPQKSKGEAFSCLNWRNSTNNSKAENVVTVSSSEGRICSYQINTGKTVFELKEDIGGDPQINNFDYGNDSTRMAVVGAHPSVRIYDVETQKLIANLDGKGGLIPGHTNRLFSVKFVPGQNVLISSGWDQRILWWDLRTDLPFDSVFGSQVYGDGLDIKEGLLLACNFRETKSIQLFHN
jgi:WD40 repeat protein